MAKAGLMVGQGPLPSPFWPYYRKSLAPRRKLGAELRAPPPLARHSLPWRSRSVLASGCLRSMAFGVGGRGKHAHGGWLGVGAPRRIGGWLVAAAAQTWPRPEAWSCGHGGCFGVLALFGDASAQSVQKGIHTSPWGRISVFPLSI